MVREGNHEKESKTSSTYRPFDIENLFAPDKQTKEQKRSPELRKADPYRPNFAIMESAALSVNGNYVFWLASLLYNKRNIKSRRRFVFSCKFMDERYIWNQSKKYLHHINGYSYLTVEIQNTLFSRFK